jgi:hypothetical protein
MAPGDRPIARYHAIAGDLVFLHSKFGASMNDELIDLDETAFIEQEFEALARRHFATIMLLLDALRPTALLRATIFLV